MAQPEEQKHKIAHCPEHVVRMRAMIRPGFYLCKKCKAIWFMPIECRPAPKYGLPYH